MKSLTGFMASWNRFWFTPSDPIILACIRIGCGLCLLWHYGACRDACLNFIGPEAWINNEAVAYFDSGPEPRLLLATQPSIWKHIETTGNALAVFDGFLIAIVSFTIGFLTRTSSILVLVGHLSFVHRGMIAQYGVDQVMAMLLLYLAIGGCGLVLSVDSQIRRLSSVGDATSSVQTRRDRNSTISLRLIQLHLCLIYLCAGTAKLQGETWWDGSAIWYSAMDPQLSLVHVDGVLALSDEFIHLISLIGVILTLVFEIGFCFLMWRRRFRPYMFVLAVVLHAGIWVCMGLGTFSAVMMIACLSFVEPDCARHLLRFRSDTRLSGSLGNDALAGRADQIAR